jgi:glycosyltransferase involved in cell wall biosynthesis
MRFPRASNPIARWALRLQERASIAIASAVLTVNDALAARLRALGVRPSKVTVVMNSPSTQLFDARAYPRRRFRDDGRLRLVYTGALTPIYELDVVLRALATVLARRPDLDPVLRIYGRGDSEPALRELAASLGITGRVDLVGRIPLEDVPAAVAEADIGLAPTRRDAFTERSLSTKVFEYAAMGKPVVASRLPMVVATFAGGGIHLYASGDADDLARVIIELADDAPARDAAVAASRLRLAELGWDRQAARYLEVVDRLTARRR